MEFFITKKTWLAASRKIDNPRSSKDLFNILKRKPFKWGSTRSQWILVDFKLELDETKNIPTGFFLKKCTNLRLDIIDEYSSRFPSDVEIGLLKYLIENEGLPADVKHKGRYIFKPEKPVKIKPYVKKGFVYFMRNQDLHKIGITDNLLRRFNQLNPDEVLNVVRCSNYETLERQLHKKFKEYRIPQTEYFRLSKSQIEQVNIEMTKGADF